MRSAVWIWILMICLLLTGCSSFLQGEYMWEQPHSFPSYPGSAQDVSASNYDEFYGALADAVHQGMQRLTVSVKDYDQAALQQDMQRIGEDLRSSDPIAAYAVQSISCTQGTSGGAPALAVEVEYLHSREEIFRIKRAEDPAQARELIGSALNHFESGVVIFIESYSAVDFEQMVEDYAMLWPQYVMELPQVKANIFPETGKSRVVELRFIYQTSRESLKNMQFQVEPIFAAAQLYVQGDGSAHEKYTQLYAFLTERYHYQIETSITPSYSLLRHGVGDSKAFATVFAAMCRLAGLECMSVSGTRDGESHYWNIIRDGGVYYHVDLLRGGAEGEFCQWTDGEMTGYVWDYSAYPACGSQEEAPPVNQGQTDFGP